MGALLDLTFYLSNLPMAALAVLFELGGNRRRRARWIVFRWRREYLFQAEAYVQGVLRSKTSERGGEPVLRGLMWRGVVVSGKMTG